MHLNLIGSGNPNKVCLILALPGLGHADRGLRALPRECRSFLPQLWAGRPVPSTSRPPGGPGGRSPLPRPRCPPNPSPALSREPFSCILHQSPPPPAAGPAAVSPLPRPAPGSRASLPITAAAPASGRVLSAGSALHRRRCPPVGDGLHGQPVPYPHPMPTPGHCGCCASLGGGVHPPPREPGLGCDCLGQGDAVRMTLRPCQPTCVSENQPGGQRDAPRNRAQAPKWRPAQPSQPMPAHPHRGPAHPHRGPATPPGRLSGLRLDSAPSPQ